MNNIETPYIAVPLGKEAHRFAKQFADTATLRLRKRVYLNTLAVYVVHRYLKWLEIETDLSQSDSWQPGLSALLDIADLVIPNLGKLECRPVLPGDTAFCVPPEAIQNRIGYVAVRFSDRLEEVQLLGFAPAVDASNAQEQLLIENLQPLENLFDYLERLRTGLEFLQGDDPVAVKVREILETRPLSEIVPRLEHIYRSSSRIKWRYAGADVLAGSGTASGTNRESIQESQKVKLQTLSKRLLEKLAEIWENAT
ncbi:MAG: DUF1822 family protein [Coleofasciculus sp. Co-bin14]|nr:DUF1822 family protein [Coleofasciculus sp. Co-bin14]